MDAKAFTLLPKGSATPSNEGEEDLPMIHREVYNRLFDIYSKFKQKDKNTPPSRNPERWFSSIFSSLENPDSIFYAPCHLDPADQILLNEAFVLAAGHDHMEARINWLLSQANHPSIPIHLQKNTDSATIRLCQLLGALQAINFLACYQLLFGLKTNDSQPNKDNELHTFWIFKIIRQFIFAYYDLRFDSHNNKFAKDLSKRFRNQILTPFIRHLESDIFIARRQHALFLISEIEKLRASLNISPPDRHYGSHTYEPDYVGDIILKNLCVVIIDSTSITELMEKIFPAETRHRLLPDENQT